MELVPPAAGETAVAPAGAAAADVLLQDHDAQVGVALGEEERGPQAGETAADDHDVGVDVTRQGRAGPAGIVGEGLAEPPAALGTWRECRAGQVQGGLHGAKH